MGRHLTPPPSALVVEAEAAAQAVPDNPTKARLAAADVLDLARRRRDVEASVVARRAIALAAVELGDPREAWRQIRRARSDAERVGLRSRAVQAAVTGAAIRFLLGDVTGARELLDRAEGEAVGEQRATVLAQRTWMLWRSGSLRDAAAAGRRVLALRAAPPFVRATTMLNLGCVLAELGELDAADALLCDAEVAYEALGVAHAATSAAHDRALLAVARGHIPEALRGFDDVEARMRDLGAPLGYVLTAQLEALLDANLTAEAAALAPRAVAEAEAIGEPVLAGTTWQHAARAAHLVGDETAAVAAARRARARFARQGNHAQVAVCRYLELSVRDAAGRRTRVAQWAAVADALDASGLVAHAVGARADLVRVAAAAGETAVALANAAALRPRRRRGPALLRAKAWYADALGRRAAGDRLGADRAVAAALVVLDEHRAALGATELRAEASGHGAAVARLGVALAVESGRPARVLAAVERWRAGAMRRPPVVDAGAGEALAALRRTLDELAAVSAQGGDTTALARRQVQLETAIRQVSRHQAAAVADRAADGVPSVVELSAALGDRALVELVEHEGTLHAVVVVGRRASLHVLAATATVLSHLDALAFALRRLGRGVGSPAALTAARASADDALAALDGALLAPLRRRLGDRPVVIVPTADLHAIPWGVLASVAGRAVTVAPSSGWWAGVSGAATTVRSVALVAGPGLPGAAAEVDTLADRYPRARRLAGAAATVDAVAGALDGADLAHLACHGHFRSDNPMFSCLEVADGPLTVYDLERLGRAPTTVVLSACDSGVPATRPGDEILGLLSALLALGTRSVVASVVPVPDLDTTPLMVALHERLAAGDSIADALVHARDAADPDTPTGLVARSAFVCFGV